MTHETECPCLACRTKAFPAKLQMLKVEAGALGLYRTMHKIDAATDEVGWEIAEKRGQSPRIHERYKAALARAERIARTRP